MCVCIPIPRTDGCFVVRDNGSKREKVQTMVDKKKERCVCDGGAVGDDRDEQRGAIVQSRCAYPVSRFSSVPSSTISTPCNSTCALQYSSIFCMTD